MVWFVCRQKIVAWKEKFFLKNYKIDLRIKKSKSSKNKGKKNEKIIT